jgi:phospholipid/cholesterol/gamma-HCH transport system permease protein
MGNSFSLLTASPVARAALGMGQFVLFTLDFLRNLAVRPFRFRLFLDQGRRIGLLSMPVASLTALFTGMVMVLQIGVEMARFGAISYAAGITIRALTRELIPVFTAIVVGARVAASMTAELGTMRVTEQLDAMTTLSVRPIHYLVVPRVVMATLMLPIITIYSGFIGYLGGWIVGILVLKVPAATFLSTTLSWLEPIDVFSGMVKTFFFGLFVGLGGCYYGFRTEGGAEGGGKATTNSVVFVIIMVLAWDFILTSWLIYLLDVL